MTETITDSASLVPGALRLRPDDHFMVLMDTDTSPMTIGALLLFDIEPEQQAQFGDTMRRHFIARLNHTVLPVRLVPSPDGYDSDIWADLGIDDAAKHVMVVEQQTEWSVAQLYAWAAQRSLERLDLAAAAFCIDIIPSVANGQAAVYVRMHHSVADGVGFQTVLSLLSDQSHPFAGSRPAAVLPDDDQWRRLAEARFVALEAKSIAHRASQQTALSELKALKSDPTSARARTPVLAIDSAPQADRSYATISLPLDRIKAVAAKLNGTVNDIFMTMASGATRQLLIERDALPETPVVANSARSYRRPEHGLFGNRIVALHPHLATHLLDPMERLRAIQSAMAVEWRRTHFDEAMLDQPERPYGARDRRCKFAERATQGGVALPGNVSLSNVPGPADVLSFGGFAMRANYPVPIIGNGRVLNITSRRNAERLDIGIMGLPSLLPDATKMSDLLAVSLAELEQL